MAIITRENLKTYLGISGTSEDDFLDLVVAGVDTLIESLSGRRFESETYTEQVVDGTGRQRLYLPNRPLTAVSEVRVSGEGVAGVNNSSDFDSSTIWNVNDDYVIDSLTQDERNQSLLVAVYGVWPLGIKNVRVTYTAGYTTVPADIKLAAYQIAARVRNGRTRGGMIKSERMGDESYELFDDVSRSIADSVLAKYREVAI